MAELFRLNATSAYYETNVCVDKFRGNRSVNVRFASRSYLSGLADENLTATACKAVKKTIKLRSRHVENVFRNSFFKIPKVKIAIAENRGVPSVRPVRV